MKDRVKKIEYDLYRYSGGNRGILKQILSHPGARFMYVFRNCESRSSKSLLGLFFRIWFKLISVKYGVEIPHSSDIKEGLYMGHFKGIIINQNCKIGRNCNISQGVTIGRESRGERKGCPILMDRVSVGPNSVIVGKITIGNDVLIAPLTFVNFNVPDNSVVMGNPAKIVATTGSGGYVNKILVKDPKEGIGGI